MKKILITSFVFLFLILGFVVNANQSLKPGSQDRGFVDGWYCSTKIDENVNENNSPFVQNRDYRCSFGAGPETGRCLFTVEECYDCSARATHKDDGSDYETKGTLTVFQSCVHNNSLINEAGHYGTRPAYHGMSDLNYDPSDLGCSYGTNPPETIKVVSGASHCAATNLNKYNDNLGYDDPNPDNWNWDCGNSNDSSTFTWTGFGDLGTSSYESTDVCGGLEEYLGKTIIGQRGLPTGFVCLEEKIVDENEKNNDYINLGDGKYLDKSSDYIGGGYCEETNLKSFDDNNGDGIGGDDHYCTGNWVYWGIVNSSDCPDGTYKDLISENTKGELVGFVCKKGTNSNPPAKCGGEDGKTYAFDDTSWGTNDFCEEGDVDPTNPSFPGEGETRNWTCNTSSGDQANCSASRETENVDPICNIYDNHPKKSGHYLVNLQDAGNQWCIEEGYDYGSVLMGHDSGQLTDEMINNSGGAWRWRTNTNSWDGPSSVSVTSGDIIKKVECCNSVTNPPAKCGGEDGKTYAFDDTSWGTNDFCEEGDVDPTNPSFPGEGETRNWTCNTSSGDQANCSASRETENVQCCEAGGFAPCTVCE
ncbi:hypothetical protein [Candidatus Vampirococcus lugosii]|uniref:Uncharacterized protein n=1 Tax=Candidatus Vampirococcus lugosii TaxID=2789015 RepID=A0ABS5QLX2_9BACT|nr:hypothetical protein [Candidatus Vampirococcus lugosii]MBS8122167.1 hypothetical protein [Candidatus Vampirococcus lugosii]